MTGNSLLMGASLEFKSLYAPSLLIFRLSNGKESLKSLNWKRPKIFEGVQLYLKKYFGQRVLTPLPIKNMPKLLFAQTFPHDLDNVQSFKVFLTASLREDNEISDDFVFYFTLEGKEGYFCGATMINDRSGGNIFSIFMDSRKMLITSYNHFLSNYSLL